jgi:hypothetical protein
MYSHPDMMDHQKQTDKARTDHMPEVLEDGIKRFHLAMKKAILYPQGHPFRVRAASEIYELLQEILSDQGDHSITAIDNKLYIDWQETLDVVEYQYIASDGIYTDLARRFRLHGVRSIAFSRGMERWEMERLLDIMTMRGRETIAQGGASKLLDSDGDIEHIGIVDIEYEEIQFALEDGQEDLMSVEEMLVLYLRGGSKDLERSAYMYLLSLLEESDQMARLIEECVDYDGVNEPDIVDLVCCLKNLTGLGDEYTDMEKRAFQRKILEAILQMESPVKSALFSSPDDGGILDELINSLLLDEAAHFVMLESTTDEPSVPLRRMFDELLASDKGQRPRPPEERLAELESAIQAESVANRQEAVFRNTVAPLLEEAFVELEVSQLEGQQLELERLLSELCLSEQGQMTDGGESTAEFFIEGNEIIDSAAVLLEMLESETDPDDYSDIASQLEGAAKSLVIGAHDVEDMQDQYFAMVFQIINTFSLHADASNGRPQALEKLEEKESEKSFLSQEMQERAGQAITNICTEKVTDQVLTALLREEVLERSMLERFVQYIGEPAISPLVRNLLYMDSQYKRQMLKDILVSIGAAAVPELHESMRKSQWGEEIKDILPILNEIGESKAPDSLLEKLDHRNPHVKRAAIVDLAVSRDPEAAEILWSKIRDKDVEEYIREFAMVVLGEIGDEQTVEEIAKLIKGRGVALKREAICALGNIGGEESVFVLSDLLGRRRLIGKKRLEELQLYAVEVLSQIDTESATNVLLEMSERKKEPLKSACEKALLSRQPILGNQQGIVD